MLPAHFLHVPGGHEAAAAVRQALGHPVHIPQAHAQAGAALAAAGGIAQPEALIPAPQGLKQPLIQEIHHFLTAHAPDQRRQGLAAAGIVAENGSGRVVGRAGEEGFRPVLVDSFPVGRLFVAGGHAQHVPESQAGQPRAGVFRQPVLKVSGDAVVQAQPPFVRQHAHGDARHGFADGIGPVGLPFGVGRVIGRGFFLSPDGKNEAVHVHVFLPQPVREPLYPV